jgi:hypothetical protein
VRPPTDMGTEGRLLLARINRWLRANEMEAEPHEWPLLVELARTADRLATARAALLDLPPTEPAWVRIAAEERQQRLAYGRILSSLGLPTGFVSDDQESSGGYSPSSRRGSKAARARWGRD